MNNLRFTARIFFFEHISITGQLYAKNPIFALRPAKIKVIPINKSGWRMKSEQNLGKVNLQQIVDSIVDKVETWKDLYTMIQRTSDPGKDEEAKTILQRKVELDLDDCLRPLKTTSASRSDLLNNLEELLTQFTNECNNIVATPKGSNGQYLEEQYSRISNLEKAYTETSNYLKKIYPTREFIDTTVEINAMVETIKKSARTDTPAVYTDDTPVEKISKEISRIICNEKLTREEIKKELEKILIDEPLTDEEKIQSLMMINDKHIYYGLPKQKEIREILQDLFIAIYSMITPRIIKDVLYLSTEKLHEDGTNEIIKFSYETAEIISAMSVEKRKKIDALSSEWSLAEKKTLEYKQTKIEKAKEQRESNSLKEESPEAKKGSRELFMNPTKTYRNLSVTFAPKTSAEKKTDPPIIPAKHKKQT